MDRIVHFYMRGRLVFGQGSLAELPDALRRLGVLKPMVVTDPGIVKAGIFARVAETLSGAGMEPVLFDRVESDPRIEVAIDCASAARSAGVDVLIGLGGGSSLDIAKVAAVAARDAASSRASICAYFGIDKVPGRGLATVMLPTTAGTGSEVTPIAVLSDTQEHLKKGIVSDALLPDAAVVDPLLALGLPAAVTAFTGMDALTHAIEAYTNRYSHPFVDTFALEAVRLIGSSLRRAVARGDDAEARTDMALASTYGGMCLGPVNTAAVHALAYPLGGTFNVPHGIANALLLPYVMDFNLIGNLEKYARIAVALGERIDGLSLRAAAELSVAAVRRLASDIRIASRLRDLDIPESAIDGMADGAIKVTRLLGNNPRGVALEDIRGIYRAAY